jgi:hypothetical protein
VEQTAESRCFNIFFIHPQPGGKKVADQAYVHTMDIGGIVQFPHIMKHIEYVDALVILGQKRNRILDELFHIQVGNIFHRVIEGIFE